MFNNGNFNIEDLLGVSKETQQSLTELGNPDFASNLTRQKDVVIQNFATGFQVKLGVTTYDTPANLLRSTATTKWGISEQSLETMHVHCKPTMPVSQPYKDFVNDQSTNNFDNYIAEIVLTTGPNESNV